MTFDDRAMTWDTDIKTIERAAAIANKIKGTIPLAQEMNALEFGCGTGLLSYFLKDEFHSLTLIDTSQGMLDVLNNKIADEKISNFNVKLFDFTKEDFSKFKNIFDVVYTSMALHHIEDIRLMLTNFYSILKADGYLCIADLDKEDGSFHSKFPDFNGHFGFEKTEIESALTQNGFAIINYEIVYEIVRTQENGETNKYPIFLVVARKI